MGRNMDVGEWGSGADVKKSLFIQETPNSSQHIKSYPINVYRINAGKEMGRLLGTGRLRGPHARGRRQTHTKMQRPGPAPVNKIRKDVGEARHWNFV